MGVFDDIMNAGRPIPLMKQYDAEGNLIKTHPLTLGDINPTPAIPFVSLVSY